MDDRHRRAHHTAAVETVLESETYAGPAWVHRKESRTQIPRPPSEWVKVPRVVNGLTLLPGLTKRGRCTAAEAGARA